MLANQIKNLSERKRQHKNQRLNKTRGGGGGGDCGCGSGGSISGRLGSGIFFSLANYEKKLGCDGGGGCGCGGGGGGGGRRLGRSVESLFLYYFTSYGGVGDGGDGGFVCNRIIERKRKIERLRKG
ncbi:hypothetical protein M0802_014970 [Mischocyttarus mexicanus]|nr:hypothetical protein M0802_014970 [Mischocyttarus mexicanus]